MSSERAFAGGVLPPVVAAHLRRLLWRVHRRVAAKRLREESRLHLGCGSHILQGWANVDLGDGRNSDVIRFDLLTPWPVESSSIDFIFSEHLIEHFSRNDAQRLLHECARALRPGGILRISTPDLRAIAETYLSGAVIDWIDPAVDWTPRTPAEMINGLMHEWGHQFLYDFEALETLLREAGATAVLRCAWRESSHPELGGLERREFHHDLIVEASF